MVFAVTYGLREYAVKKTPFRNRELQIHKKLKHPNIMIIMRALLPHVWSSTASVPDYSYHFMPRVTGDLARMVTDRRDLVMTSLTSKYHNDPCSSGKLEIYPEGIVEGAWIHARDEYSSSRHQSVECAHQDALLLRQPPHLYLQPEMLGHDTGLRCCIATQLVRQAKGNTVPNSRICFLSSRLT